MTFHLGLTGSIGMGKTTAANMFREEGCPVWDADAAVHALYSPGGAGTRAVERLIPNAVSAAGVDRGLLTAAIAGDPALLAKIEAVIHPLVRESRQVFTLTKTAECLVFDIPLLFETGAEEEFNAVAIVSTNASLQRQRVLKRPGMTAEKFDLISSKQMPDAEKRRRADYIIDTTTFASARQNVASILADITERDHA